MKNARHKAARPASPSPSHDDQIDLDPETILASLADIARTLAHDLNQPLAAASNYLAVARQAARKQQPGPPAIAEALEKASGQIARATEAVRRMRASLAPGEPNRTEQSLHALLRRASAEFTASTKVEINLRLEAEADMVLADAAQMEVAIGALLRAASGPVEGIVSDGPTVVTERIGQAIRVTIVASSPQQAQSPFVLTRLLAQAILKAHEGTFGYARGGDVSFVLPLLRSDAARKMGGP